MSFGRLGTLGAGFGRLGYGGSGGSPNLIVAGRDLSNAAWSKINVTIADAGIPDQAMMETVTDAAHQVHQEIAKPAEAKTYRVQFDVTGGLGRAEVYMVFASADQSDGLQAWYDVDVPAVITSFVYGEGFTVVGTGITPAGDALRCACDLTSDASATIHLYIGVSLPGGDLDYVGDPAKGVKVTNIVVRQT